MTELPNIILDFYARTDVGIVRNGNEDNFLILDLSSGGCVTAMDEEPEQVMSSTLGHYGTLLAVSDGMGGALAGEVASRMAVETVRDLMLRLQADPLHRQLPFAERLRVAIEQANDIIHQESLSNPLHKGLGATFTAVATDGAEAYFAQVGDSRAYLIRRGRILRVTRDQSLVQQLIDSGQITEEEAETHSYRNVILQALGAHPAVKVEINTLSLCHQDILVVCSDGLSGKISEQEILEIGGKSLNLQVACQRMVDLANERGGEDNITVVIARFMSRDLPSATGAEVLPQGLIRSPATPTILNWPSLNEASLNEASLGWEGKPGGTDRRTPPPPTGVVPFSSVLPRRNVPGPRSNDLSDRRGPITAVFALPDVESGTNPTSLSLNTETGSRRRKQNTPGSRLSFRSRGLYLAAVLAAILLMILIGATTFIRRQQSALEKQKISILNDQKQARIVRLREKLDALRKKIELQSSDKPATKVPLGNLSDQLGRISSRLDEVGQLDAGQSGTITEVCGEIERDLQKIEDQLDSLQGLLRSNQKTPVRI